VRPAHLIRIEREPFGCGYDVTVVPPPAGVGHDREFRTHTGATAYAAQLSKATGWQVLDHAGDA
jgi:hypothetical protein